MRSPHLLAGVSCALLLAFAAVTSAETDMLLIFDASGSMKAKTPEGVTRIDAAKEAFSKLTDTLKADRVGLMIFGHRLSSKDPKACQDIELAIPFGKLNAAKFRGTVGGIQALGNTPLAGSLLKAKDALLGLEKDSQKAIVLFTDGIESCGGNPEAVARELAAMGTNVKVHVVGFAVDAESAGKLKAIADAGGGKFVLAKNASELEEALPQLVKTALLGTEQKELERATILDEHFAGAALADQWEVTRPDDARLAVLDGKLVVIAAPAPDWRKNETIKNLVTLKPPIEAENFELTGKVSLKIEGQNRGAALLLKQDDRNYLELAVYGNEWGNNVQRVVKFTKVIDGKGNFLQRQIEIGNAKNPETIELKIVRVGALFEAYARGYGKEPQTWQRIGEHAAPFLTRPQLVLKSAQTSGGTAPDLEAAFDDLKVDTIVYETKIIGGEIPEKAIYSSVFDDAAKFAADFEILNAEPGYQAVQTGLVIAAKNGWFPKPKTPVKNLALLKTPLPEGDYDIDLQMSLRITSQQNYAGLALYQDDQNVLVAGYGGQPWGNNINRQAFAEKITSGESTVVWDKVNRFGAAPDPQTVIIRMQKRGRTYAVSVYQKMVDKDEWAWTPLTEFSVLKFTPRLGLFAANKEADAAELPVRFEKLVITPAK